LTAKLVFRNVYKVLMVGQSSKNILDSRKGYWILLLGK